MPSVTKKRTIYKISKQVSGDNFQGFVNRYPSILIFVELVYLVPPDMPRLQFQSHLESLYIQPVLGGAWQVAQRTYLGGAGRQRFDERAPVALAEHSLVEDGNHPPVRLGADQASKPLPEAQDGFGHGKLVEGVFKDLIPCGDYRVWRRII